MLGDTAQSIIARARIKLGDADARKYTNGLLLEHLNSACEDLERDLTVFGDTEFRAQALITFPVGQTTLGATATAPDTAVLPADFFVAEWLRERPDGTADRFTPMKEVLDLDTSIPPASALRVWEGRENIIYTLGATVAVELNIGYWRTLTSLKTMGAAINVERGGEVLALRVAHLACLASDDFEKADRYEAQYRAAKDGLETIHVKENQIPSVVPAYRYGRRGRRW